MGGCITKCCKDCIFKCRYGVKRGKFQELVTGRTPMINFMQTMKITTYEASRFIRLFEKIDEDHSGAIDIYEFFDFFDLDHSLFIKRSFLLMDFDRGNGEDDETDEVSKSKARMKEITKDTLSYEEFFVALYNYCTLDERGLVEHVYRVIDSDKSGFITKAELFDMIREIYQSEKEGAKDQSKLIQKQVKQLMNVIDEDGDGEITLEEFERVHRKLGTLIYPAFRMQQKLRRKCLSTRFWNKAYTIRTEVCKELDATVIEIFRDVREESIEALRAANLAEEEAARRRAAEEEARRLREAKELEELGWVGRLTQEQQDKIFEDAMNAMEEEEREIDIWALPGGGRIPKKLPIDSKARWKAISAVTKLAANKISPIEETRLEGSWWREEDPNKVQRADRPLSAPLTEPPIHRSGARATLPPLEHAPSGATRGLVRADSLESFDISGIEQLPQQTRLLTGGRPSSPKKIQRPSSKAKVDSATAEVLMRAQDRRVAVKRLREDRERSQAKYEEALDEQTTKKKQIHSQLLANYAQREFDAPLSKKEKKAKAAAEKKAAKEAKAAEKAAAKEAKAAGKAAAKEAKAAEKAAAAEKMDPDQAEREAMIARIKAKRAGAAEPAAGSGPESAP